MSSHVVRACSAARLRRDARARFALVLWTLVVGTTATARAESVSRTERDASAEPECPRGWYCAREVEMPARVIAPPSRRYPVYRLTARGGWLPLPEEASEDAQLFAAGIGFGYRGSRTLGLEVGPNLFFGRDYLGRERLEAAFEASALFAASGPEQPGPYVLVGPQATIARVEGLVDAPVYLGGHLGIGVSWPIGSRWALLAELDSFVQGRIDGASTADYRSPLTGARSDSAMGVLLRAGVAIDWFASARPD